VGARSHSWRRGWQALVFLAPAMAILAVLLVWPIVRGVLWSFQDAGVLNPRAARWVGAENYGELLSDPRFRRAFGNTALFALMVVPLQTTLALFLALWVDRPSPYWRWLRVPFFVPVVVSMPVVAVLWTMLYQPAQPDGTMGLVDLAVTTVGLPPQNWLNDPRLALPAIAFMSIWQGVGFQMMILLAGLQNIEPAQIEAAKVDGAGPWRRLIHVIIPGLRNSIVFSMTVTTVLAFRLFVQPFLMTGGGPNGRTLSIVQWIYQTTFHSYELGLACAAAMVFLVSIAALLIVQRLLVRERVA
jgi:ABC-type sugar transport system permease subunit